MQPENMKSILIAVIHQRPVETNKVQGFDFRLLGCHRLLLSPLEKASHGLLSQQ